MCGRFARTSNEDKLQARFGFDDPEGILLEPRYNIAPTQMHPVVTVESDHRVLRLMKWGLVPFWAKDTNIGYKMINARAEGIESKPSFREPFKKKRCLVLADGFYEWKKLGTKTKVPYFIRLKSGEPFAFAGLWDVWDKEEEPLETFTIITTDNNELIKPLHNRMPVILHQRDEAVWLDPELRDPGKLLPLLKPYPSDEMDMYEVSTIVNSPKNDVPDCIKPSA
jgi:putative SOS response-associated peptidase YedK